MLPNASNKHSRPGETVRHGAEGSTDRAGPYSHPFSSMRAQLLQLSVELGQKPKGRCLSLVAREGRVL